MKKTFIYSVLFTTIFLTGCEQPQDPMKEFSTKSIEKTSTNEAVTQVTQNVDTELNEMVKKLKLEDPTIVDAYYSFDENGEKVLNINSGGFNKTDSKFSVITEQQKFILPFNDNLEKMNIGSISYFLSKDILDLQDNQL